MVLFIIFQTSSNGKTMENPAIEMFSFSAIYSPINLNPCQGSGSFGSAAEETDGEESFSEGEESEEVTEFKLH